MTGKEIYIRELDINFKLLELAVKIIENPTTEWEVHKIEKDNKVSKCSGHCLEMKPADLESIFYQLKDIIDPDIEWDNRTAYRNFKYKE